MKLPVKSKTITLALHGIIWGFILALPLIVPNPYNNVFPVGFAFIIGFVHLGLFYFNAFFLYPTLINRKWWWLYPICLVLLIVGIFNLKYYILTFVFPTTVYSQDMNGLLGFPIILFLVASIIFRVVLNRIRHEKMVKEREAQQLTTELKFLRSQISPHFLFNVLNNMVSMARHKSDQLEPALIRLAGLMRYMLYESEARKVALTQEIDYLKSYIELQKIRYEEDVKITFDIQNQENTDTIEPMLLIPFVENAFKHGTSLVEDPFIRISLKVINHTLHFSVENKFSDEVEHSRDKDSGIGLANVQSRLQLLYPGQYILTEDDSDEIFRITLKLPLL